MEPAPLLPPELLSMAIDAPPLVDAIGPLSILGITVVKALPNDLGDLRDIDELPTEVFPSESEEPASSARRSTDHGLADGE
jgi:hypothetical protein